jgi:hypothetical protein
MESPAPSSEQPTSDQARPAEKPTEQSNKDEYEDDEKNYQPRSLKFWTILLGTYLSLFLVALDRTIIATAIPRITDEFHSIEDIGYVD